MKITQHRQEFCLKCEFFGVYLGRVGKRKGLRGGEGIITSIIFFMVGGKWFKILPKVKT